MVDQIGTAFEADFTATGFGKHMAVPQMREHWKPDMTEGEARNLLEECMRVLFYRDCRTINRVSSCAKDRLAVITTEMYSPGLPRRFAGRSAPASARRCESQR